MSYVFSDQQSKLSSLLGDSDTDSDAMFTLAIRKKEINRGELNFALDSRCIVENATGTIASGEISVPSDWIDTYMLIIDDKVITNDNEVALQDWERWVNWNGSPPKYYFWEFSGTRKIKILPSSNVGSYSLYYFKRPVTELSADGDVSLLAEEYREGPVFFAASELLTQIGKTEMADYYRNKYDHWVGRAKMECEKKYVNKQYARPDRGEASPSETDIQGMGKRLGIH
jgi:hypothetical protein